MLFGGLNHLDKKDDVILGFDKIKAVFRQFKKPFFWLILLFAIFILFWSFYAHAGTLDTYPNTTAVDGRVWVSTTAETWSALRAEVGNNAIDDGVNSASVRAVAAGENLWNYLMRGIVCFPINLTADDVIDSAYIELKGHEKENDVDINIFSANPASKIGLTATDFSTLGTTAYSTAISVADFLLEAFNHFTLNTAGISYLETVKTGVGCFGMRYSKDASGEQPANGTSGYIGFDFQEAGVGSKPLLHIVYHEAAAEMYKCSAYECVRDDENGTYTEPTCNNECGTPPPPPGTTTLQFYQQQDTSTTTLPTLSGGNIGQSNFTLNNPATSTLVYLTAHLKYNNSDNTGQTHKICVSEMFYDSGWYVLPTIGCFEREIGAGDFSVAADYRLDAAIPIVLTGGTTYAFYNIGVATSTNPYDIIVGINNMPSLWYGSPNEMAYGSDNLAASAAFTVSWPNGLLYKNSPETGYYYGVADLFFIINYGGETSYTQTCEGGGFFDELLCNLYNFLFIPDPALLNRFSNTWDNIKNKPPFGYFTVIKTNLDNLSIGTTTIALGLESGDFFGTIRTWFGYMLWFMLILWIFNRIRHFDFF